MYMHVSDNHTEVLMVFSSLLLTNDPKASLRLDFLLIFICETS